MRGLTHEEIQAPPFAPTIAVEILSPGDDPLDVASEVDIYLRGGSSLVIVVDPKQRTMQLHDSSGPRRSLRAIPFATPHCPISNYR